MSSLNIYVIAIIVGLAILVLAFIIGVIICLFVVLSKKPNNNPQQLNNQYTNQNINQQQINNYNNQNFNK